MQVACLTRCISQCSKISWIIIDQNKSHYASIIIDRSKMTELKMAVLFNLKKNWISYLTSKSLMIRNPLKYTNKCRWNVIYSKLYQLYEVNGPKISLTELPILQLLMGKLLYCSRWTVKLLFYQKSYSLGNTLLCKKFFLHKMNKNMEKMSSIPNYTNYMKLMDLKFHPLNYQHYSCWWANSCTVLSELWSSCFIKRVNLLVTPSWVTPKIKSSTFVNTGQMRLNPHK